MSLAETPDDFSEFEAAFAACVRIVLGMFDGNDDGILDVNDIGKCFDKVCEIVKSSLLLVAAATKQALTASVHAMCNVILLIKSKVIGGEPDAVKLEELDGILECLGRPGDGFGSDDDGIDARFIMFGLDGAGKTTVLYRAVVGSVVTTIPTIGYNAECLEGVNGLIWDIGGHPDYRGLWRVYYSNASGIIFVVDSSNRDRMDEARDELANILDYDAATRILILANKQDLPNVMSTDEVAEKLGVKGVERVTAIACSAETGLGIPEFIEWARSTEENA
jgi:small GTP-binding protein